MNEQEIFKLLENADWEDIYPRLLAFTLRIVGNRRWRGVWGASGEDGELADGVSCQDLVKEVICQAIARDRRWNPEKGKLEPWLRQQIMSEISHLIQSASHTHERVAFAEEIDTVAHVTPLTAAAAAYSQDPAAIVLSRAEVAERVAAVYDAADADPELEALIMAVLDGCEPKPRFLADELNTTTADVNNRVRKLRRHVVRDNYS